MGKYLRTGLGLDCRLQRLPRLLACKTLWIPQQDAREFFETTFPLGLLKAVMSPQSQNSNPGCPGSKAYVPLALLQSDFSLACSHRCFLGQHEFPGYLGGCVLPLDVLRGGLE